MIVKEWIPYTDESKKKYKDNIGMIGGWFNTHILQKKEDVINHTWQDYINKIEESKRPYFEAIRTDVIEKNIQYHGGEHQSKDVNGVPLFEDDVIATFSLRGWGDLMAAIWTSEEDPKTYMDFYYIPW